MKKTTRFMKACLASTLILGAINVKAQTYVYPDDTLVDPSFFSADNRVTSWEEGYCEVDVELGPGGPTSVLAPCFKVTYIDHFRASSLMCPPDLSETGGLAVYYDVPYLLDADFFTFMESEGENIVSATDFFSINHDNLTTGITVDGGEDGQQGPVRHCIEAELFLDENGDGEELNDPWIQSFEILMGPIFEDQAVSLNQSEYIGLTLGGTLIEGDPPSLNGHIIALDRCGWHPEPSGFGHFHTIPSTLNIPMRENSIDPSERCAVDQAGSAIAAFTFEGIPVYGPYEDGMNTLPTDLDSCGGHVGPTPDYDHDVYHYHTSETNILNYMSCRVGKKSLNSFTYGENTITGNSDEIIDEKQRLVVYPSISFDGKINVKGEYEYYQIFNEAGQLVNESKTASSLEVSTLDLSNLKSGIYFIQAENNSTVLFEKFIIE